MYATESHIVSDPHSFKFVHSNIQINLSLRDINETKSISSV